MRGKGLKKWGWIGIAICLFLPASGYAKNDAKNYSSTKFNRYPMETILTQPEKIENELVPIKGYAKFEKDGVILYYTKQDYQYDTKENAVWLPERKELSIEEYFQDASIYRDISGCVDGAFYHISGVIQQKNQELPYAAVALYYIDNDDGNKINSMPETMERYNRDNESQKAEEVSIYRLLADPWRYDGKKVSTEVCHFQELEMCPNHENTFSLMIFTPDIYGDEVDWESAWRDMTNRYSDQELLRGLPLEKKQFFVECAAYNVQARFQIEMMFYMHGVSQYEKCPTMTQYTYWPFKIEVHKKDIERYEQEMERLYEWYKERGLLDK